VVLSLLLAGGALSVAAPIAACSLAFEPDLTEIAQRSRFIALVQVESRDHPTYDVQILDVVLGDVRPGQRITVGEGQIADPTDSCDLTLETGRRMVLAAEDPGYLALGTSWAWSMQDGDVVGSVGTSAGSLPQLLADLERRAAPPTDAVTSASDPTAGWSPWWLAIPAVAGAGWWFRRRMSGL
jgi:hypothetical protein